MSPNPCTVNSQADWVAQWRVSRFMSPNPCAVNPQAYWVAQRWVSRWL